ncbi:MAG: SulP family inorganic anion transporter [Acidimicrobiales bacterium]|jgi:SulP family sulfate permease|nr:SulP family inorganic anion transporter [Acidimicrobiales bacterium]
MTRTPPISDAEGRSGFAASTWRRTASLLPRRSDYAGLSGSWRSDVVAGLTVGVVALPLALAFGVTTGLGAAAGLTTAIVAGLVAAVFGGSNVQVSGPTGAMTVVLVPIVARDGADAVAVVGAIAGILVVAAGVLRLGRVLAYIPWPVVEGFTLGIAVIIFLQQVPAALGVAKPDGENTAAVAARAAVDALDTGSGQALALVLIVVVVMVAAPRLQRALPASLLAVVAATGCASVAGWDVATIGALPSSLPRPGIPSLPEGGLSQYFGAAFAVAALAAIESLLSAKVADGMADGDRHDPDRELLGQGLANIVSPLFGGMPATGAIARTAVNVRAGARTRVAAIVHTLALIAVVLVGSGLVAAIPLAALAGVLMVTAVRMVETHNIRAILRSTRSDALVLVLTALATVAFDLIVAVEIGVAVAAVLALRNVARNTALTETPMPQEVDDREEHELLHEHIVAYRIDGALFFGAAQRFLTDLTQVADVRVVILRLPDLQVLDATGAHALGEIVADLERRGITVLLKGPRPEHERVLRAVGALDHLASDQHLFTDLDGAVAHARLHAAGTAHHPVGDPPAGRAA